MNSENAPVQTHSFHLQIWLKFWHSNACRNNNTSNIAILRNIVIGVMLTGEQLISPSTVCQ